MPGFRRHTTSQAAILATFMRHYPKPLKKYDLEKECGLARETVREWVPKMVRYEWIEGTAVGKSNAGKNMIDYTLTDRGCFQAACLNPTLQSRIKRLLGSKYGKFEEVRETTPRRRAKAYFERWLPTITKIVETGTAQPGFYYCLELTTDKNGTIRLGKRSKVGLLPTT